MFQLKRGLIRHSKKSPVINLSSIWTMFFGTIVGFRCPLYVNGINVPGYHLHFINGDRTRGGHVLSFEMINGKCEVDVLDQFFLRLPDTKDFAAVDLAKDRNKELKNVERGDNKPDAGDSK